MLRHGWPVLFLIFLTSDPARSGAPPSIHTAAPQDAEQGGERRPKIRLKLAADPQVGFTPLTTMLTGTLSGVAPDDPGFCHPAVTWIRVNPGQPEENASRYHQDSACRHEPGEAEATTTFTRYFDLYRTGPHLFKLVVESRDGRRAESGYVQVQVLRIQ